MSPEMATVAFGKHQHGFEKANPAALSDHRQKQEMAKGKSYSEDSKQEAVLKIVVPKTILVEAQPINLGGNNSILICRHLPTRDQDPDQRPPNTFVLKEFGDNKDELDTYEQLACLQGVYIPRCFGEISWVDEEGTTHEGIALEFLEGFRSLQPGVDTKDSSIYEECKRAINAISQQGIYHGDIEPWNLLWEPVRKEIRVIDFEFSAVFTQAWARDNEVMQENGTTVVTIPQQNLVDLESIFT